MSIPNVNGSFVNTDNSHGMSYTFTNTMVPHTYPPCLKYLTGGKNKNKRYSMKSRRNKKFRTKKNKSRKNRSRKNHKRMAGGYSQYQNNQPFQMNYSIGTNSNHFNSALANPAPYFIDSVSKNLAHLDNYNHYLNKGFASKGWF